jgi:hypothetical protein
MIARKPCRNVDVFVSYSSHDREWVLKVVRCLESAGVNVWIDTEKIDGATRWAAEIVRAIEACKVVLLMCSDASMRSWAVTQEVQLAGEDQKCLLPLLLEKGSLPAQMKFFLAGFHWIELFANSSHIWVPQILRALKRAGVTCDDSVSRELTESVDQPTQLDWSLDGLRSVAQFTDQLWAFPADRPMPNANRTAATIRA